MHPILTNQQMAEADRRTIESGVAGFDLMQRAGQGAAEVIRARYAPQPVCVLCGPGNNGGDGFVIARDLRESGWPVRVACLVDTDKLTGDAATAAQGWVGDVIALDQLVIDKSELVIDALFGTGLTRALESPVTDIFTTIRANGNHVIGIDVPSGVNGDDGAVDTATLGAELTITFAAKKLGHVLMPGMALCGSVHIVDIGIDDKTLENAGWAAQENAPGLWRDKMPVPRHSDHKYTRGHTLVYAGAQMTGAARLAAENAARAGAGLVSLVCTPDAAPIFQSALPPHIIVRDNTGFSDQRVTARVIGPGGMPDSLPRLQTGRPGDHCIDVLDGDALQADTELDANCIITPHEGEFRRTLGDIGGAHKGEQACKAAARFGGVVVYKGADTVIADERRAVINTNAPASLATAGAGDSLAGIIAGLAGQGMPAFEAACAGVWLHGAAAKAFGPGLVAADIAGQLPAVLRDILRY